MATVREILLQTGFSPSQIAQIDTRAISAFDTVLTQAEAEREQAELSRRANTEFYETKIIPALTSWEAEQQQLEAAKASAERERNYYRAAAVAAGIVPGEEPNRDASGRYVASAPGSTPGSPTFTIDEVKKGLGQELGTITDVNWRHMQLYGKPMPLAPTEFLRQAEQAGVDPASFADRKFKFSEREAEIAKQARQAEIDAATKAAVEENNRKWAERASGHPDLGRPSGTSAYAPIRKGIAEGQRPDPLRLSDQQRRQATRQQIHKEIEERQSETA